LKVIKAIIIIIIVCDMLLRIPAVSCYEDTAMLKELLLQDRCQKILQVPISLLRQMSVCPISAAGGAAPSSDDNSRLKMALSLQLYFSEA